MPITIRPCIICHSLMKCARNNKYACSNLCHSKMHKRRAKLGLSTNEIILLYKKELEAPHETPAEEETHEPMLSM